MTRLHNIRCSYIFTFILLALTIQVSPVFSETYRVNNHQIEVTLVPDKPAIMLGEPTYISFVVQNHSDVNLAVVVGGDYRNRLGRPESFTVAVTDKDGKNVFQPNAGMSMGGLMGPQKLPAKGNYIFRLFLPNWATFKKTGNYSIFTSRDLQIVEGPLEDWFNTEKTSKIHVQASTHIDVTPYNSKKMGALISNWGDTMLTKENSLSQYENSQSAAHMLSALQDVRTIPYFAKALDTRNYGLMFKSLNALAKFDNKTAFEILKKGMKIQGKDIANTTTTELANQSAGEIRLTAAQALSNSPYPGSIPFLLTQRHDTYVGVRITVVQAAGKLEPETAIPILQEMSNDKDKQVSDEAKRYLKMFAAKT